MYIGIPLPSLFFPYRNTPHTLRHIPFDKGWSLTLGSISFQPTFSWSIRHRPSRLSYHISFLTENPTSHIKKKNKIKNPTYIKWTGHPGWDITGHPGWDITPTGHPGSQSGSVDTNIDLTDPSDPVNRFTINLPANFSITKAVVRDFHIREYCTPACTTLFVQASAMGKKDSGTWGPARNTNQYH